MKLKKLLLVAGLLLTNFLSQSVLADISGMVFRDYNQNSIQDSEESGVSAITVTAYDDNGVVSQVTTDNSGAYNLVTSAGKYRVEITNLPSYLRAGTAISGTSNALSAMVNDGVAHNVGLNNPSDYSQANPHVAIALQVAGIDSNYASIFEAPSDVIGSQLVTIGDISTDGSGDAGTIVSSHNVMINSDKSVRIEKSLASNTGSVWGLAWEKSNKNIYTSAVLRRYTALKNGNAGAIYKTDKNNTTTLFATIPDTGYTVDNANRNLNPVAQQDTDIVALVGRAGLGGLEISEDESELYVINLHKKELVTVSVTTSAILGSITIPNPYPIADCINDNVRPWAVKVKDGAIYVGSLCESNARLGARIQQYDGVSFTLFASTNTLLYPKPSPTLPTTFYWHGNQFQSYWNDTLFRPQPIFSDIEFDNNKDLILSYIDRTTFVGNLLSSGDIRRMCYDVINGVGGNYVDESTKENPTTCTSHLTMYNIVNFEEYYSGDYRLNYLGNHPENVVGGLAMKAGSGEVLATVFDPATVHSSGFSVLDNKTGFKVASQEITEGIDPERSVYQGKGGGVGDIEILSDPASIELGNYVWDDADNDGIQDPSEAAVAGVVVKLYDGGSEVGSATTNASGHYYFGGLLDTNMTTPLKYGTAYQIRIDLADAALGAKSPTTQDAGAENQRDSDGDNGTLNAGFSTIAYTTGSAGENDHQQDFGFRATSACVMSQPTVTALCNNAGTNTDPSDDTFTYTINATVTGVGANYSISGGDTQAGLSYGADHVSANSFLVSAGALDLTLTDVDTAACVLVNVAVAAPATCSTVAPPPSCTTIMNTASVTAVDQTDTDATNDTASASVDANCTTPEADLELVKTADKSTVFKGDTLIYTLTLTNKGASDATDVEVTDTLPANVTFVSATAPAGTSFDNATKVWTIPSLPAASGSNVLALQIEVTIN